MDALLIRSYRDEIQGFSSGPWLVELKEEIDIPDQPHPSVFDYFDDYDGEGHARQSSADESLKYSVAQVGASESAAAAAASAATPAAATTTATATATATASATADKAQASRKRKVTSKKPVMRRKRALKDPVPQRAPSPNYDRFVGEEDIRDDDILGGRGGRTNNHEGNKRFRKIVADMKGTYRETGVKTDKTALSRGIVEYVHTKGGRFLIETTNDQVDWRVMTKEESRKKTSQALRETKEIKWTI
ncbi:hypothetical protein MHU86_15811 [Fragilaria crotonensis]|nr:hypothetical protein MHU86_15811 [Fragilaria crotonensis]